MNFVIPIMRPKLPASSRLISYLEAIDSTQIYSNFGPLVCSFEERLAAQYNVPAACVTTVANATVGLSISLAALGAKPGTLCVMPAWTFIASAHAAILAGMVPYFVDVDCETWALNPDEIGAALAAAPGPVGAVMPVAPFGRPISGADWDRFRNRSGIPVVIDAAAGFDALIPGALPTVVSLHATKVLGVGEGGFVVSTDEAMIRDIRTRSNFGFRGSREAAVPATNGKLSEYHAAVGLAALDEWTQTRAEWIDVARAYQDAFSGSNELRFQEGFGDSWITSTCVLTVPASVRSHLERALDDCGIETRRWWGDGAHLHHATSQYPRAHLPNTPALAASSLALPFYRGATASDISRVTECVLASSSA
jgi:dTDP-4-amino-4,6-dideoxygalactose transaminase